MTIRTGQLDLEVLAYAQSRQIGRIESGDLVSGLGITEPQERKTLSRLARKGQIVRLRRGLYLVPSRLPLGGKWSPGEAVALTSLIEDRDGQYQICGPNAFSFFGWDDQVPNRVYAYNNRISGERMVGPHVFTLIRVANERLGSIEVVRTPEGIDLIYSSRPRSLFDAVYDWPRFNTLPRAYRWIGDELQKDEALAGRLVDVTLRYGNQGTIRRIGRLLEQKGVQETFLRKLERSLRNPSAVIPWVPTLPKRGKLSRRWGLILNDAE